MSEIDKNTPLHTYWTHIRVQREGTVVVNYATCPACDKYPVKGKTRCPYCGQKLILPIDVPDTTEQDYKCGKVWIV